MTVIRQEDFIESVADALQFISYYHPLDFVRAVNEAYEREQNPAARDAMAQILINSRMCAQGHRPICQDTGIVTVFLKIGMDVRWEAELSVADMVNEGRTCIRTMCCAPPSWRTRQARAGIPGTTRLLSSTWKW
jgi:fumarate hydratase class I